MDFSHMSFESVWNDEVSMREDARKAQVYAWAFLWCATMLCISIVRTISTSPGNIPDHREWDMASQNETSGAEDEKALIGEPRASVQSERFTNPVIERLTEFPRDVAHEDYKYLITGEGPMVNTA